MPVRIGDNFAGYRVVRLLGSGGMGDVYLVQHPRLPRQDALKVLRPDFSHDGAFRERFIREADLASGLRHPHIVGIHDRGEDAGQLWIAMEYINGTDLSHLLAQRYPQGMPVGHVLPIVTAVASALDYANKNGLLHRDVKPANILVADLDTDDPKIFLADFGIARPLDDTSGITTTNMTVGTVAYAAPEQLMGDPMDGRADQYALAATTYHLLTGEQLFPNSNPAVVISRHLNAPVPALADIRSEHASLDPVLASALAKNPDDRFTSNTDFARALADTVGSAGGSTVLASAARRSPLATEPEASAPQRTSANSNTRTRWMVGGSVAAVLLLFGAAALLWQPWHDSQSQTASVSSDNAPSPSASTPAATTVPPTPDAPERAETSTVPTPTPTVTAAPTTPVGVAFSPTERDFLDSVASLNAANGYTSGPTYVDAIAGGGVSKQQQDRALLQRGYQLCAALGEGLDSAAARQRVLEPFNDHSIDMFDYYGAIVIGYATYRLCPEHSDKTGQI